ncbi:MAG: ABC transporter permease [Nitrososphaerota archaeon]|nr:ABC transporter permease [Nitrososphaerota archaeon]
MTEKTKPKNQMSLGRLAFITGDAKVRVNKEMIIGGVIVAFFVVVAIAVTIADILHITITPYNPDTPNVGPLFGPPSLAHPMGTDNLGRDQLSRILAATPNAVVIGFVVVGFSLALGLIIGSFAGFHGGFADEALMRLTDIFFAIPALVLAIAIVAALHASLLNLMIALMIVWWPAYARLSRGETLKVSHQNYIEAARTSGYGSARIIFRHVLPNIFVTLVVYATLDIGTVILTYSGLSYLGLSVPPPAPDWGYMVASFGDSLLSDPWLPLFPGLLIAISVIGFSIFGDGFRDAISGN